MENKPLVSLSDLTNVNPLAHDQKFVLNKPATDLETLRKTFKATPSSVLGQVRDFLPKLASANDELKKKLETEAASSVDIEHVEEDGAHIEMNIALMDQDSDIEDSDSDSNSCSSCDDLQVGEVTETNIRLPKQPHKHPLHRKQLVQIVDATLSDSEASKDEIKSIPENNT